jgi:hypothetical protein
VLGDQRPRDFVSHRSLRGMRARTAAEIAHATLRAQPPRYPPPKRSFAMTSYSLTHLRGRDLEASYDRVAAAGARTTALQLAHITELDHQGYYLVAGYSSMFRYCVNSKGLSDDIAVQWIRADPRGAHLPGDLRGHCGSPAERERRVPAREAPDAGELHRTDRRG